VKKIGFICLAGALLFGAVFGFANTLTVNGVDNLGSNSTLVNSPTPVNDVTFSLKADDYTMVDDVEITFDDDLPVSSWVYVELTDSGGDVIAWGSAHVDPASATVTVDVGDVKAEDVCDINITVVENIS